MKISVRINMKSLKLQTHGTYLSIYRKMQWMFLLQLHIVHFDLCLNTLFNGFYLNFWWFLRIFSRIFVLKMSSCSHVTTICKSQTIDTFSKTHSQNLNTILRSVFFFFLFLSFSIVFHLSAHKSVIFLIRFSASALWFDLPQVEYFLGKIVLPI